MNRLERWFLRYLLRKEITQGYQKYSVTELYQMIRGVVREKFTEDNEPTTDAFLRECFESTQFVGQT